MCSLPAIGVGDCIANPLEFPCTGASAVGDWVADAPVQQGIHATVRTQERWGQAQRERERGVRAGGSQIKGLHIEVTSTHFAVT